MTFQQTDPEQALAEGFAEQVARWAGAAGGDALLAREVARQLSLATSRGHVCVTAGELAAADAALAPAGTLPARLQATGVAGTPEAPRSFPLIVDGEGRIYLHRYFDYERRLARRLALAARMPPREPSGAARDRLATLFGAGGDGPDWQKIAAALALRHGLAVISGGPGTGKTTTVVNLLACLLAQDAASRIALAAPTGKAAARMTEAIRHRAAHLPPELLAKLPQEAFTIHRLLRYHPGRGFGHDRDHPLPIDVLVVDEASMLDLALATRLLEAVPPGARIVLLGDKDQLAAVESGAVFAELCADPTLGSACRASLEALCGMPPGTIATPAPAQPGALHDAAVWLTRNYRFSASSGIGRLAAQVNAGQAQEALAWLDAQEAGQDVCWQPLQAGQRAEQLPLLREGYGAYFEAVLRNARDVAAVHEAFARFRVLCAVRAGEQGAERVNEALGAHARLALQAAEGGFASAARSPWYTGRPVMVTVNDYALKLFNGDIGIALPDAAGQPLVFFPDGGSGWRGVAPARMPPHETAFAMTVHKSQGSEFDEVAVLLPATRSAVLTRELLYTAVTRARRRVALLATQEGLREAISRKVARASGLPARLREAMHDA